MRSARRPESGCWKSSVTRGFTWIRPASGNVRAAPASSFSVTSSAPDARSRWTSVPTAPVTGSMRANWPKSGPRPLKPQKHRRPLAPGSPARSFVISTDYGRRASSRGNLVERGPHSMAASASRKTLPPPLPSRKNLAVKSKPPPAAEPAPSRSLRRYLYFTAAITGAAIMVVEILGAKMLSPFVGLSHFVWTAQIAVTLVALACGYYAGGRLADRSQRLTLLYWAILSAAIYLAITVLICEPVAYWCLDFNLAVGSLLASTILFFVPLALLAMTGPFLVRVITASVAGLGGNVGRLTSISTLGSFVGTMLIGYLMIPLLPNSVAMYITALALMLVCAGYFLLCRRAAAVPLLLVLALASAAVPLGGIDRVLRHEYKYAVERFDGNSHFGRLQVLDERFFAEDGREVTCRYYLNDFLTQNTYDPQRKQSVSHFTYMLSGLVRAYTTNIQDVLCIGLGVGIVPM